ncbi:zincin-like metallopeptidase domain-containing protein [soil metagenome]
MNVYEIITARILDSLTNGVVPWRRPWRVETPRNLVSRKEYRGVNVMLLQAGAFESSYWLTFKQAKDLGGVVKRGERGCPVIFWRMTEKEKSNGTISKGFILRYFTAFNVEQTEGIEVPAPATRRPVDEIEECERIVTSYQAPPRIEHGGGAAFYVPSQDRIQIPGRKTFSSAPEYYSTLFHELVHSTGAGHRLARKGVVDPSRFATHDYSFEELVAECGAAFLCAQGGISPATLENQTAYLGSWVKKLRSEPKWIIEAAAHASKAADLVLGKRAASSDAAESADGVAA